MSSTETGAIFGNIVYEGTGAAERQVVVLNDIHIDILDYIAPAFVGDVHFRSMWAEFEWENKVSAAHNGVLVFALTLSLDLALLPWREREVPVCVSAESAGERP